MANLNFIEPILGYDKVKLDHAVTGSTGYLDLPEKARGSSKDDTSSRLASTRQELELTASKLRLDLRKVEEQILEIVKQEKVEEARKVLLEKALRDVRKELSDELERLEIQLGTGNDKDNDKNKAKVIRRVEELMAEFIYNNNVSLGAMLNNFIREYGLLVDNRKVIENIYYEGCREEYARGCQRGMRISFGSFNEEIYQRLMDQYGHRFMLNVKIN